jgi:hypothetical protein
MAEFNANFWVAAAAGAPVIALAAVVQSADAWRALDRAERGLAEVESPTPQASRRFIVVAIAWWLDFVNILIQAGVFLFSLIVLSQRNSNLPFAILLATAIVEGIGIIALLVATFVTAFVYTAFKGFPGRIQ